MRQTNYGTRDGEYRRCMELAEDAIGGGYLTSAVVMLKLALSIADEYNMEMNNHE